MKNKFFLCLHPNLDPYLAQTNERTNKSLPVFYRTSSPSGPLPCFPSLKYTIMQSRATGIADHILPLGDLLSLLFLPKCSSDLHQHCPCRPARDWGSRVSGRVLHNTG